MSHFIKDYFYSELTPEYTEEYIIECTRLAKIYLKLEYKNGYKLSDFLEVWCDYKSMNYTDNNSLNNLPCDFTKKKYNEILKIFDMYYKMDELLDMINEEFESRINNETLTYRFREKLKKSLITCKEFCYLPKLRLYSYEYKDDPYYYRYYDSDEYRYPLKKPFDKLMYKINIMI
jgi:hypothetical protein